MRRKSYDCRKQKTDQGIYGKESGKGCFAEDTKWINLRASWTEWKRENNLDEDDDRIYQADTGGSCFDGAPWNYRAKNQVAYMSTEPFYYDFMNIGMVGKYYSDFFEEFDQKKFHDLIAKVGLSEEMKMREISTGMMAKLKVIATLSRKAMLYMLDEPLNGIDLKAREEIIDVILTTVSEKNAVIISTHLIEEIESFIDHAIFMKDGSVIYECDVEEERMRSGRSAADLYRELM